MKHQQRALAALLATILAVSAITALMAVLANAALHGRSSGVRAVLVILTASTACGAGVEVLKPLIQRAARRRARKAGRS